MEGYFSKFNFKILFYIFLEIKKMILKIQIFFYQKKNNKNYRFMNNLQILVQYKEKNL